MTDSSKKIFAGIDTHADFHHVAVITGLGESIEDNQFAATPAGYDQLLDWLTSWGEVVRVGVEGTGSYGAAVTKRLAAAGMTVIDVIAPDKQERRLRGKTDQIDAYSAARAVLSGRAVTTPKFRDGQVEALRLLRTTRRLIVKQRTETMNQLKGFLVSSDESFRAELGGLTGKKLATLCSRLRLRGSDTVTMAATRQVLRLLGGRYLQLDQNAVALMEQIESVVTGYAPELLTVHGIGPDVAATLLIIAGENIDRIPTESALAHLAGTAPIPASSGKTNRYRLNRGGNRQGNAAFHRIVLVRMKSHQQTRDYVTKTLARGKTKRDTMRLLKRYLAREIFPLLISIQKRHNSIPNAA